MKPLFVAVGKGVILQGRQCCGYTSALHALAILLFYGSAHAQAPKPGIVIPVKVIECYDGDTLTVSATLTMRIRLLDCWAPEIKTTNAIEKAKGLKARDYLKTLAEGKSGMLQIPLDHADRLDDLLTLGRVLGHVWIGDLDLSKAMTDAGHATKTKQ